LPVQRGQAAPPAFWDGWGGQRLILGLDGGPGSTALSAWLAATFPNLFGANAGADNLTGMTNLQVARFYQLLLRHRGRKLEAAVLALALSIYASTPALGGTDVGDGVGVSVLGLGPQLFGVGRHGAAFGVPNQTLLSVYQLLKAVDDRAFQGVAYNGNPRWQHDALAVLDALLGAARRA
jgi:hypothetical protein